MESSSLNTDDDSALFFDYNDANAQRVSYQITQKNWFRGIRRKITVYSDNQCRQQIKKRGKPLYQYKIDLAFLDPRAFRNNKTAWGWYLLSLLGAGLTATTFINHLFAASAISFFGVLIGSAIASIGCLFVGIKNSSDVIVFRSYFGQVRLIEINNNLPNPALYKKFIAQFVLSIKAAKAAKALNKTKFLSGELKQIRRLKDESIISPAAYQRAKAFILSYQSKKA